MSSHGQRLNKTIPWSRNKLKKAGYPQQKYFYTLKLRKGCTILEFIFFDFVNYNLNHSMTHPENLRKSIRANRVNYDCFLIESFLLNEIPLIMLFYFIRV